MMKGALLKQGNDVIKKWKRRLFELEGSTLQYYEDFTGGMRIGDIPISGAELNMFHLGRHRSDKKDVFSFGITPKGEKRSFILAAETAEGRSKWVMALLKAGAVSGVNRIIHEGWLEKTGAGGIPKGFKRRYFVMTPGNLKYYDKPDSTKPSGAIVLKGTKVELESTSAIKYHFSITLQNGGRRYDIKAASEDVAKQWVDICNGIDSKKTLLAPAASDTMLLATGFIASENPCDALGSILAGLQNAGDDSDHTEDEDEEKKIEHFD